MIDVKNYIENEINYIEEYDKENCKEDLEFLYSLTDEDIKKIQKNVELDSELSLEIENLIRESINYWLYHYNKGEK